MQIFFNSSMPRSGSTLLQNILGNNPDIYSTPTSGLIDLIKAAQQSYSTSPNIKAQDELQMKKAFLTFCQYGLHGFFKGLTDRKYIMEKSRGWMLNYPFLECFYPSPKIVCMVRDLREVIGSMENNFQKNRHKFDIAFDKMGIYSIDGRADRYLKSKPVGMMLNNIKMAFQKKYASKILFVKFEALCESPDETMAEIYQFLGIPYFHHDFSNIKQVTFEDDKWHGIYGDHKIKSKITPLIPKSKELLGKEVCDTIYRDYLWYFKAFNYK